MGFFRGPQIVRNGLKIYLDISNKKCVDHTAAIDANTRLVNLMDSSIKFKPYETTPANMYFEQDNGLYVYRQDAMNGGEPCWHSETSLPTSYNYTFIIWFKYLTGATNQRGENIYGGGFNSRTSFYLSPSGTSNNHGYLRYPNSGSADAYGHQADYDANLGDWHCFATVDSGGSGSHQTKFYLDGILRHTYPAPAAHVMPVGDYQMTWGSWSNTYGNFNGSTNLYMYYDRALTDGEILQNFNATKSRFGL